MCGYCLAEHQVRNSKRKVTENLKIQSTKKSRSTKRYSNYQEDFVKTFCCECGKVVTIAGLEKHLFTHAGMNIEQYKQLYGNPLSQIIDPVYHKCGLCSQELLLDVDGITKHVKGSHHIDYRNYSRKFIQSSQDHQKILIPCDQCGKAFYKNIQLRAHKKGHSLKAVTTKFHGFEVVPKRKESLQKMINLMESTLSSEKWGFQLHLRRTYL